MALSGREKMYVSRGGARNVSVQDIANFVSGGGGAPEDEPVVPSLSVTDHLRVSIGGLLKRVAVSALPVLIAGSGAVQRLLSELMAEWGVSVVSFGADPTGVAPCDTAWANALSSGHKHLHWPAGVFRFSDEIPVSESVFITGKGRLFTMLKSYTSSGVGMNLIGESGLGITNQIRLKDFTLEYAGSSNSTTLHGLRVARKVIAESCVFKKFPGCGAYFDSATGTLTGSVFFAKFTDCWFRENGVHGTWLRFGANGNYFGNCQWTHNKGDGLRQSTDGGATYGNAVDVGQLSYNSGHGLYLESGTNISVRHVYGEYNGSPDNTDTRGYETTPYDFRIDDNVSRSKIELGVLLNNDSQNGITHVRAPARGLNDSCIVTVGSQRIYTTGGGVTQTFFMACEGPAVADIATANAAVAAGATPTKAEFDAAVSLLNGCKAKINELQGSLRSGRSLDT